MANIVGQRIKAYDAYDKTEFTGTVLQSNWSNTMREIVHTVIRDVSVSRRWSKESSIRAKVLDSQILEILEENV